jgi:hypothetical protein
VPLSFGQFLRCRFEEVRVGDVLTVRSGQEVRHAHADADDCTGGRQLLGRHVVAREDHVPAASLTLDRHGLDAALYGPVLVHAYMSDT